MIALYWASVVTAICLIATIERARSGGIRLVAACVLAAIAYWAGKTFGVTQ